MSTNVSLSASMRQNLFALQNTTSLMDRTQTRLSTGKKVNTALDDPISFFTAQSSQSRSSDLSTLKNAMSEAVQTVTNANNGITTLTSLIDQAKALGASAVSANKNQVKVQFTAVASGNTVTVGGKVYTAITDASGLTNPTTGFLADVNDMTTTVANLAKLINAQAETTDMVATASGNTLTVQAKTSVPITQGNYTTAISVGGTGGGGMTGAYLTDSDGFDVFSQRKALGAQYEAIIAQIDSVSSASSYQGINLLAKDSLKVKFETSVLVVNGFSATASDLGLNTAATTNKSGTGWGWSVDSEINTDMGKLDVATSTIRSQASNLSTNLSIINNQKDFMTNVMNTLQTGSDNLTLADMNEEGANMLSLQTKQNLGMTALSLASQAQQAVMRLFG
jgi:flagellin